MLEQIAEVIRQDPSATAKDIARKLGYSEEKSIYYWLEKGQFKGLRDFRQAVLTGRFPAREYIVGKGKQAAREGEPGYTLQDVPMVTSFSTGGKPVVSGETVSAHFSAPREAFGFLLGAPEYAPVLFSGDVLLIDPLGDPSGGDLVLVFWEGHPRIVRYYPVDSRILLVHPVNPASASVAPAEGFKVIGRVSGVIRRFPSPC